MKINLKSFFCRNRLYFVAFFIPVILLILTFAVMGIYPFGENQIPVIDMYHQYIPFLSELQYKLQEGGSLFYTWNGAGGSNFWNLIAYYGASPLNLLLVLFPQKLIVEGVTVILLIKVGLAGSFMAIYLRNTNKGGGIAVVGFSTLYALCSYVMAYYWCIMWIDAVALLPLCILGLNRLIDEGKTVMYTVTLALIVFINYYMAIMVCIFILFYYPVLYFIKVKNGGARRCLMTLGNAVGHSLLGVVMAGVMLLPTYISMQSTYYISSEIPEDTVFYNDPLDILNQLLPNAELTYREGLPNLYCGIIVVILLVFYFLSRTVMLREKALNTAFLVFIFLSLNINKLDFIWHGFHFPNQLPYRYTFAVCFILIGMAYKTFLRIDEVRLKHLWGLLALGIGYYLMAQKLLEDAVDDMNLFFYGGVAWLTLYCVVIAVYKKGLLRKELFVFLTVILIVCEMTSSACTSMNKVGTTSREGYFANNDDIRNLVESTEDDFARMEINDNYVLNCPALYHFKGISQFSSSINADTTAFMEKIGVEGEPGKNRFNYNQTNPVTNAILNVKYLIGKNLPIDDSDFVQIGQSGNTRLYENRYPLSIGYMAGDEIRTWDTENGNPFDVLDDYVRAATAGRYTGVFNESGCLSVAGSNVEITEEGSEIWRGAIEDLDLESKVVLRYRADESKKYYVFIEADNARSITVDKGSRADEIGIRNDCGSIVNIGEMEAGEEFSIVVDYEKGDIGEIEAHVCSMDESAWEGTYDILSENMMTVEEFGDTYIRGSVKADEDGVFVLSVPYEKGWTLKVDGEEREIGELVGDCLISTALSAGEHEIEITFRPPGLIAGALCTLAACGVLVLTCRFRKKRREKYEEEMTEYEEISALPPEDETV